VAGAVVRDHGAGKAIPVQAWPGPEGSRKLRLPDESGKTVNPPHQPPFLPGRISGYSFLLEADSTPGLQCSRKD